MSHYPTESVRLLCSSVGLYGHDVDIRLRKYDSVIVDSLDHELPFAGLQTVYLYSSISECLINGPSFNGTMPAFYPIGCECKAFVRWTDSLRIVAIRYLDRKGAVSHGFALVIAGDHGEHQYKTNHDCSHSVHHHTTSFTEPLESVRSHGTHRLRRYQY